MKPHALLVALAVLASLAPVAIPRAAAQAANRSYREVVLADRPIAYYRLDERSGTIAHDASGHHLDGRIGARVRVGKQGLIRDARTSFEFDGANRSSAAGDVRIPGNPLFARATTVSIEAWVYPYDVGIHGDNSGDITMVAYGNDDAPDKQHCRYALELDAHSHVFHFPLAVDGKDADPIRVTGVHSLLAWLARPFQRDEVRARELYGAPGSEINPPAAGRLYHLVGTYDGATMRLYVNGVLNNVMRVTGRIVGYDRHNGMGIGGEYVDLNPVFHGRIAEVAVYPAALTLEQVRRHHAAGIGASAAERPAATP